MKQSWSSSRGCIKIPPCLFIACTLLLAAAVAVLFSCATVGAGSKAGAQSQDRHIEAALEAARSPEWIELSPSIWRASLPAASCGTELAALKIKLNQVSVIASLPAGKSEDDLFFAGEFAADFAARTGAAVAVNMTPFSKKGGKMYPSGIYT